MSLTQFDPELLSKGNFENAINQARKAASRFAENPEKQAKYKKAVDVLERAQNKLKKCIEATKKLNENGEPLQDGQTSFYDSFVKENENAVSICWLNGKVGEALAEVDSATQEYIGYVSTDYDIFDATAHVGKEIVRGKKVSKNLAVTCLGVGAAELLARGVTGILAKNGIMAEGMGLLGLGKLGIENLPALGGLISQGATAVWGFSPLLSIAALGFVALKVIPVVSRLVNKAKEKYNGDHAFEKGMEQALNGQKDLDELLNKGANANG